MPEISPPPPIGTTSVSSCGHVLEHLERDRALAGHDQRVVVRRNVEQPALGLDDMGVGDGVVEAFAVEDDRRAVALGLAHLHVGGEARHDDGRRDAEPPGVIGETLRVVAGARGDHAARALGGVEAEQLVERAAFLVGGGELEVLELQPDLGPGHLRQRPAVQARRPHDGPGNRVARGKDVGMGDRKGGGRGAGCGHPPRLAGSPRFCQHRRARGSGLGGARRYHRGHEQHHLHRPRRHGLSDGRASRPRRARRHRL